MSTEAFIQAMGPFSSRVADHLEYPARCYEGCREGVTVFSAFFHQNTRDSSKVLAEAMGAKPFDFSTHELDVEKLKALCSDENWDYLYDGLHGITQTETESLAVLLQEPGWRFFYRVDF
jgi:hypothetical protein